jgi:hypothetical protein
MDLGHPAPDCGCRVVVAGQQARAAAMTRRVVLAEEDDVYTGWRRVLCWTQRPGTVKAVKRRTHKRERREALADIACQEADR